MFQRAHYTNPSSLLLPAYVQFHSGEVNGLCRRIVETARFPNPNAGAVNSETMAQVSVNASPPDLILMDLRVTGMNCLETCRRLKSREDQKKVGEQTAALARILRNAYFRS